MSMASKSASISSLGGTSASLDCAMCSSPLFHSFLSMAPDKSVSHLLKVSITRPDEARRISRRCSALSVDISARSAALGGDIAFSRVGQLRPKRQNLNTLTTILVRPRNG